MRVGVLGGGQLGRMLALAGHPLGLKFTFLDPTPDAPMAPVADGIPLAYDDPAGLDRLAAASDVVTWEFENVGVEAVRRLEGRTTLLPSAEALLVKHDRLNEKRFFEKLKIPTARYVPASTFDEFERASAQIGYPLVIKSRRLGYDGKGQAVLRDPRHARAAWEALKGAPTLVEECIAFDRELSILAVRGRDGEIAYYPLTENYHKSGILRWSIAPAPGAGDALATQATEHARTVLEHLNYAGVLAIEFFETKGRLLANELAPRVHNSGHWTIEGAVTSQFENHLRAVVGLPPGSTSARGLAGMINILGEFPDLSAIATIPGAHIHLYGKSARPGRKLGHVNLTLDEGGDVRLFERRMRDLLSLVTAHEGPAAADRSQLKLPF
jgi:5-(carboxyamino)imidazole ribonucleotide synthase